MLLLPCAVQASGVCFNGPQSWLLGWIEVPEDLDLFFDVNDVQAALSQVEKCVGRVGR